MTLCIGQRRLQKGEVKYQMDKLEAGEYTPKLRAWDIANNKAEAVWHL